MTIHSKDYVSVIYNEQDRPLTSYPAKLSGYIFKRLRLKPGARFLDVGCGRGEFLNGFIQCGVISFGVDQSQAAKKYCSNAVVVTSDVENDGIPFEDDSFDVVYSKSVIEHFYYPERMVKEVFRVLKPGGIVIKLCPDWESNFRVYFEDYTHRTPFMRSSLRDIFLIHGFENVGVERFRQLPILWGAGRWLLPLAELTRVLVPSYLKRYSKWIRFSKELMLLSIATKPLKITEINSDNVKYI